MLAFVARRLYAGQVGISPRTVEYHLSKVVAKLGVSYVPS
ncbi:MAG TPA: LuxR C-terminal-related transcriptional regulator [Streptosporangiaceae bacterium]|nr:LuxR C-terminal-related transcriptional regulator [Streptosporangiaceae bacterium]